jgi:hypothetical protein
MIEEPDRGLEIDEPEHEGLHAAPAATREDSMSGIDPLWRPCGAPSDVTSAA